MKVLKKHRAFQGQVQFCQHESKQTKTAMNFSTFVPDGPVKGCLIWLSGLTCTEETFMAKASAFRYLGEQGLMVLCPDTSPRGLDLPHERDHWDFGVGAGFYVDATTPGYRDHYRMYSYISLEIPELIAEHFGEKRLSLFGHSMGGHGALVIGLRNPHTFVSVSAFAPIVNPMNVPWGKKAFAGYLGGDEGLWATYDACELLKQGKKHPVKILVDQGTEDAFLKEQLQTQAWSSAAETYGQLTEVRMLEGFDHSYYFISTFMEDHIKHHAR